MFGENKALLNPGIPYLASYRVAQVGFFSKDRSKLALRTAIESDVPFC